MTEKPVFTVYLGETKGRGRMDRDKEYALSKKAIFMYPLLYALYQDSTIPLEDFMPTIALSRLFIRAPISEHSCMKKSG